MITIEEEKILDIISKRQLVKESDLRELLKKPFIPFSYVHNLIKKKMLVKVSPLGELSYTITEKGLEFLKKKI
jgi:hypothetical protein